MRCSHINKNCKVLKFKHYDCIHVNTILDKWFTKDSDISNYSDQNNLILITKDADFRDSYFLKNTPKKLVKINLGNISNSKLIEIIDANLEKIEKLNSNQNFIIEIDSENCTFSTLQIVL